MVENVQEWPSRTSTLKRTNWLNLNLILWCNIFFLQSDLLRWVCRGLRNQSTSYRFYWFQSYQASLGSAGLKWFWSVETPPRSGQDSTDLLLVPETTADPQRYWWIWIITSPTQYQTCSHNVMAETIDATEESLSLKTFVLRFGIISPHFNFQFPDSVWLN